MTAWPNWVDLVIVTITLRTCYNGYVRGFITELCYFAGAVAATVLVVTYWEPLAGLLRPWVSLPPELLQAAVFWGFFLIVFVLSRAFIRRVTDFMKWERIHWSIQGMGMVLGTARGLWWSGFLLLAFSVSGFVYMQQSILERSVLAPRLTETSRVLLEQLVSKLPGTRHGIEIFIPPLTKPKPK